MDTFFTQGIVHSKNALDEIEIIEHIDNNHVTARYKGKLYSAISNPFSGYYYVDDIDGEIKGV